MMVIYHTVEDTGLPEDVEENAPYLCTDKRAWLGCGFYFWEYRISHAHHWGKTNKGGEYMICQSNYDRYNEYIWDLEDTYPHQDELEDAAKALQKKHNDNREIFINQVIEFLVKNKMFKYKAIRACGIDSFGKKGKQSFVLRYKRDHEAYTNFKKAVQICFIDSTLFDKPLKVVYPDIYVEEDWLA